MPLALPDAEIDRILVVTAHPDDADFGAAGTIASWTDAGIEVAYCVATRGDAGGFDDTPREEMPALREAEQRAAAAVVGVKDVTFLDHPDGRVVASEELRRDITREIRRFRPQRLLCQSPERNWQRIAASHPDHRATGDAALCAVYPDARNPFAHPRLLAEEGLADWAVREVWMMAAPASLNNHYVDITDTIERKLAALRAHVSQISHLPEMEGMVRGWLSATAAAGGLPEGRLAEVFHVISTA
ncbi:MAG: PIG-L family deacetylase [Actinobacteria bacterium]|nr:PIG-L family deacetylase [Actinomycetota bacterium]MBI3686124.1 PIG-L family deacetylase [Actinomycetota bacterium]